MVHRPSGERFETKILLKQTLAARIVQPYTKAKYSI